MKNLFIDTNILLRFYAYSDDTLTEIEKISALQKSGELRLLVTEQIVEEHYRNRDRELSESFKRIEGIASSAQVPRFAEHYEQSKDVKEALDKAKNAKVALVNILKSEIANGNLRADKVIDDLFSSTPLLKRTDGSIERARLRRELGNPPGKKDSLGDQINWEILIENIEAGQDIHIISKDGDYRGAILDGVPNSFLSMEWKRLKGASVFIYSGLSDFAKKHFPDIKLPSDAIKSTLMQKLSGSGSFSQTHDAIAELNEISGDLSATDAIVLLNSLLENLQINWIISDDDVKDFFKQLYLTHWSSIPLEMDEKLNELDPETFGLPF